MSRKKLTYKEGNLITINIIIYLKSNKWLRESNNRLWKQLKNKMKMINKTKKKKYAQIFYNQKILME